MLPCIYAADFRVCGREGGGEEEEGGEREQNLILSQPSGVYLIFTV